MFKLCSAPIGPGPDPAAADHSQHTRIASSSLSDRLLALNATATAATPGAPGVALESIPDYNPLLVYP